MGTAPPRRAFLGWNAQRRGFAWTLVRTDFQSKYQSTLGGVIWSLLRPAAMFGVLATVFRVFFKTQDYLLYLILGIVLWEFFSEGTSAGFTALLNKRFLLTKTRFPRYIVVLTAVASAVPTLLAGLTASIAAILWVRGVPPPAHLLLFVMYLVQLALIVVGLSLGGSALMLRFRDLNQIWDLALQSGFFLAPISYPIGVLPERLHLIVYVVPVTAVIQLSRQLLLEHTIPTLKAHLILAAVTLFTFSLGCFIFSRVVPRSIENL
jgi:lipopolysaccharide transport system permease protein